ALGQSSRKIQIDALHETTGKPGPHTSRSEGSPPLLAVSLEQLCLAGGKLPLSGRGVRHVGQLTLDTDELGLRMVALFIEPVGENEPRTIVLGSGTNGSQKSVFIRHGSVP